MNQKSKLTFGKIFERFSYGCGDFGCNIIYTAINVPYSALNALMTQDPYR